MNIDKQTPYGGIDISNEAIASVAGAAAGECYGVLGLVPKSALSETAKELLRIEEYVKGVYVRRGKKGFEIDVYIACAYGVKLSEVASEVQKRIRYEIEKTFEVKLAAVNVFVMDIQEVK